MHLNIETIYFTKYREWLNKRYMIQQLAYKIENTLSKNETIDILEFNEMCVSLKKYGFGQL